MIFIHEDAPPRGPKFAEGMKYNKNFIMPLVEATLELEASRILPNMTEIHRFYLYTLSRDIHDHGNVIVLRASDSNFFVLEISCNHEYDGSPRIYLTIDSFFGKEEDLVFRGRVWDSGLGLVYSALNLVDRLSFYFRFRNNAMRFVEKYLTLLGIGYYRCMHDFERVLLMAYGLSAAEIFLDLYFRSPRPQRPQSSMYMMTQVKTLEKAFF
ncbi:uncharacterized protein LOC132742609 [Ruditapes philippinarum]|uniref:uncharacterized protein LOC132742609 n=1 Tax=Ruditapes philippinarum TaxID=129788 RepID=UPI00295C23FA|nr:uncharacterized protein LOC132742609 [Ruditapes philippinarum]